MSGLVEHDALLKAELERIIHSPLFLRSPLMRRLLTYLVERKLTGFGLPPKAYHVATEGLGRSVDFDPATDSYPRVMVGRLRTMLDRYYMDLAWERRLRIPLGSYEIDLVGRTGFVAGAASPLEPYPPAASSVPPVTQQFVQTITGFAGYTVPSRTGRPTYPFSARLLIAILTVALLSLAGWMALGGNESAAIAAQMPPLLEVSAPVTGGSAQSRALGRGVDAKLRDGLRRFTTIRLQSANVAQTAFGSEIPDFRLDTSILRSDSGVIDVSFVLNRIANHETIWSSHVSIPQRELPSFDAIAPAIAQIAGEYGEIAQDFRTRNPDNFAPGYPCMAQFRAVILAREKGRAAHVVQCLRASMALEPTSPIYPAALSYLRMTDWHIATNSAQKQAILADARSLARRAYDNGEAKPAGMFAVAALSFVAGECERGMELGRAAVALNPYDTDMIGNLGLYAFSCDEVATGELLTRRALLLDPQQSAIAGMTLAFSLAEHGKADEAKQIMDNLPANVRLEPHFLLVRAVVAAHRHDLPKARQYWRQMAGVLGQPVYMPPEKLLSTFIVSERVRSHAVKAVEQLAIAGAVH